MSKKLFVFNYRSRGGSINGLFISTEEEMTALMGSYIDFGEVLGKHSDVSMEMKPEYFQQLEVSEETLEDIQRAVGGAATITGYNPFDYLEVEPDEYDEESDTSLWK